MEFTVCIILSWVSFVQHYVNKIHPDVCKSSQFIFFVFSIPFYEKFIYLETLF